jgi:hypothetical protein
MVATGTQDPTIEEASPADEGWAARSENAARRRRMGRLPFSPRAWTEGSLPRTKLLPSPPHCA